MKNKYIIANFDNDMQYPEKDENILNGLFGLENDEIQKTILFRDRSKLEEWLKKNNCENVVVLIDLYSKKANSKIINNDEKLEEILRRFMQDRVELNAYLNENYKNHGFNDAVEIAQMFDGKRKFLIGLYTKAGRYTLGNKEILTLGKYNIPFIYKNFEAAPDCKNPKPNDIASIDDTKKSIIQAINIKNKNRDTPIISVIIKEIISLLLFFGSLSYFVASIIFKSQMGLNNITFIIGLIISSTIFSTMYFILKRLRLNVIGYILTFLKVFFGVFTNYDQYKKIVENKNNKDSGSPDISRITK